VLSCLEAPGFQRIAFLARWRGMARVWEIAGPSSNPSFGMTDWVDMRSRRALEPGYGWLRASDTGLPKALRERATLTLLRWAARARPHYAELLGALGLTPNQHAILCCLEEVGPLFHAALADRLNLDTGDLGAFLEGLQERILIFREGDDRDRRRRESRITQAGRRLPTRVDHRLDEFDRTVFAALEADERPRLVEWITRLDPRPSE
jgi:MarR family transcriptional regulator, lower aerobic nicotinate degradation pathway regulator